MKTPSVETERLHLISEAGKKSDYQRIQSSAPAPDPCGRLHCPGMNTGQVETDQIGLAQQTSVKILSHRVGRNLPPGHKKGDR